MVNVHNLKITKEIHPASNVLPYQRCHRGKHILQFHVTSLEVKLFLLKKVHGINTENQLTDQFTKGLPQYKFEYYRLILMG